jgi:hypothetical protein
MQRTRRRTVLFILLALAVVGVVGVWGFFRFVGPKLVVENHSGMVVSDVAFRDMRTRSTPSRPATWPSIAPGGRVVHRIRGDDQVELTYTLNGVVRTHTGYTPVGPIEAWVITIHPDGSATAGFGLAEKY